MNTATVDVNSTSPVLTDIRFIGVSRASGLSSGTAVQSISKPIALFFDFRDTVEYDVLYMSGNVGEVAVLEIVESS